MNRQSGDTADAVQLWCKYDFEVNKHHWRRVGMDRALPVRARNLSDLADMLTEAGISFWLQGKTLKGAIEESTFLDDHDDDIGVRSDSRSLIEAQVLPKAIAAGFRVIRNEKYLISVIRDDRYLDLCLFESRGSKYGYADKWFPRKHFETLESTRFLDRDFPVPSDARQLLKVMYEPGYAAIIASRSQKFLEPERYFRKSRRLAEKLLFALPHPARMAIGWMFAPLGLRYQVLSEQQFRDLLIEPEHSFNWKWRKPHLDIITNNQRARRVSEIIDYIGDPDNLDHLLSEVSETDTTSEFYEPCNYDPRFWQSGNNFFIYNVKYQFRRGVLEYGDAAKYISAGEKPALYTSDYYESLPEMGDLEIGALFLDKPIEITNGAVTSGKHRVTAMIGRIVAGKHYIPIPAVVTRKADIS